MQISWASSQSIYTLVDLSEAVSVHVGKAARKLRLQNSVAGAIQIHIRTNPHRIKEPQYNRSIIVPLSLHIDDTLALTAAALCGLNQIYSQGYAYAKAGAMLMELLPHNQAPKDLFTDVLHQTRRTMLMSTMDGINRKYGANAIGVGVTGIAEQRDWMMRQGQKSPNYEGVLDFV